MRTVYCTATKSWVTCTPEIEAVMRREGESPNAPNRSAVIFGGARTGPGQATDTGTVTETIVESFKASFLEQFAAGLLAARNERTDRLRAALGTLSNNEVTEAAEQLQAARKAEGKPLGIMEAATEVLGDRREEFEAAEARAMNAPHEARMRAFNRARQEPPVPSLAEREAAVANDPTIHAEAELMVSREGVGYLDAVRKIEHTRALEARLEAAKLAAKG